MISLTCMDVATFSDTTEAAREACARIAPAWPLDRSIAVNPYWKLRTRSFAQVAQEMHRFAGSRMAMPLSFYKTLWASGAIARADLQSAMRESGNVFSMPDLLASLNAAETGCSPLPLLSDALDLGRDPEHQVLWREHITTQISQCCASFFDEVQADWRPDGEASLYRYWRATVSEDRGASLLMGDERWRRRAALLPENPDALLEEAVKQFALSPDQVLPWFVTALYRVSGWAAWCAYLEWQARLAAEEKPCFQRDLLAIRVAWEVLLVDGDTSLRSSLSTWQLQWHSAMNTPRSPEVRMAEVWQRAQELAYARQLFEALSGPPLPKGTTPRLQAVFCIDVRSEVLRRHLERRSPECQTLGFAGFFGVPMAYRAAGAETAVPHLPGLFASAYTAKESTGSELGDAQHHASARQQAQQTAWRSWHMRQPASSFNLVETEGPLKLATLLKCSLSGKWMANDGARPDASATLTLHAPLAERIGIAGRFLRATGLSSGMAPTVLVVGHGSETTNNPMAAALDCGACGGQTGLPNARVLCALLNDGEVREGLRKDGINVPEATVFVPALHNTTVDRVTVHPGKGVAWNEQDAAYCVSLLEEACAGAREERAARFPGAVDRASALHKARRRSSDWAEVRPEWGLADNASLIVGRRDHTRGLHLQGRSFLHEYDAALDSDGSMLAQILGGPMIVTNWINMQYFASCVDPHRFGSGNKTLHNVVGGHIGVFEGNGGDLRIGLARQSVHDGTAWRHTPLRLIVVIYAEKQRIESALQTQPMAMDLVNGRWLHVYAASNTGFEHVYPGTKLMAVTRKSPSA